jgi:hypothetical protein
LFPKINKTEFIARLDFSVGQLEHVIKDEDKIIYFCFLQKYKTKKNEKQLNSLEIFVLATQNETFF